MGNSHVEKFYGSGLGDKLIDKNNFPTEISSHVSLEFKIIENILTKNKYELLVEAGCMDARLLDLAQKFKVNYLGLDLIDRYIIQANEKIYSKKAENADAVAGDITTLDLKDMGYTKFKPKLVVFPFNSFGNLEHTEKAADAVAKNNSDILILTYQTNDNATNIRKKYYESCNYPNLNCMKSEDCIQFVSADGLKTSAYTKKYFSKILVKAGFKNIIIKNFKPMGTYVYGKLGKTISP